MEPNEKEIVISEGQMSYNKDYEACITNVQRKVVIILTHFNQTWT